MENSRHLAELFIEMAPVMIRTVKAEIQKASDGQITHPQYRILANLNRGLTTVGQIALNHGVSQPAMSKMVDSLVEKGWVQRSQKSDDRRQVHLEMTQKGLALFHQLKSIAAKSLSARFDKTSPAQQKKLARALQDLSLILNEIRVDSEIPS